MLRYALRRILLSIPTLIATSLVVFFVTTLAPDPGARDGGRDPLTAARDPRVEEERRARFLDLPRFVNSHPQDLRSRAKWATAHIAADDATEDAAEAELRRLGGAALPYVLPELEALPPDARARVAVALGPVAERMGIAAADDLSDRQAAALFWARFWDDRALDFTKSATDRAVARLVEHGSDQREEDLVRLDTFALPAVIAAMKADGDRTTLARLTRIARHATERGKVVGEGATPSEARRALADWQEWWFVHATDVVALDGADRALAVVTETRYAKWVRRAVGGELGVSAVDGEPIADKLSAHAPVTLLICTASLLLSWALAVPIGAYGAWRKGGAFDVASTATLFLVYAMPTFVLAELLRRAAVALSLTGARPELAVVVLALSSLPMSSRWQRTAMLEAMRRDFVRTAIAKGVPGWRVAVDHALRNALAPTVTLMGLHLSALVGGAFVVEEVFGVPGIGFETLRAIETHDSAWLMAVVLATAVAVIFGLVLTDLVYGALDPRAREELVRRQGRRPA